MLVEDSVSFREIGYWIEVKKNIVVLKEGNEKLKSLGFFFRFYVIEYGIFI